MIVAVAPADISVIVPAHNEAENLPTLLAEIAAVEAQSEHRFEIVIVDDASSDATHHVLEEQAKIHPNLVVARLQKQSGQSAALSAGFDIALGEIFVTMDADLQNDPADIPQLLAMLADADMAIGWRRDRKDPLSKKIISKVANAVRNWFTSESVKDTGCGLKIFRRECALRMCRFNGMHRFFPTMARMNGYRVAEAPVRHRPRLKGKSHYNIFNRSIRPIQDLMGIRWLQKRAIPYQIASQSVSSLAKTKEKALVVR